MASDILVLVETKSGKIKKSSFELVSEATELAGSLGGTVKALLIGQASALWLPRRARTGRRRPSLRTTRI